MPSTRPWAAVAVAGLTTASLVAITSPARSAESGPRVLFSQNEIPTIRAVAQSEDGSAFAAATKQRADAALSRTVATTCQRQLRYDLPDLAMAYLLTGDVTYAQKTRDVLVGVNAAPAWTPASTTPGCTIDWGDYGWRWPQLMAQTGYAYDWIRGAGVLSDADDVAVRQDLEDGGQVIYDALTAPEYSDAAGYRNVTNYRLRNDAGLGIVALVLKDSGAAQPASTWADYVWQDLFGDTGRGTPRYLAQMVSADGVYKEGQGYYQDSFRMLTPYFVAVKNLTGVNPFTDPLVHAAYEAPVAMAMPDGSAPTVDTGWRSPAVAGGISHWVAPQYPNEPWHRWQWQREGRPAPATDQPLSLALMRPGPAAPPPAQDATRNLSDNAYGVLRTDWSANASWLMLNAERVPDRSPHEQPDQTSFAYYAKGAYLAVDPGDGRNCGTDGDRWLRSSDAHSLVSVDGKGPGVVWDYTSVPDPAHLEQVADVGGLAQAKASMTYAGGAHTTRQTLLAGTDYAVVFDNTTGGDDASHQYRWRLHLADGGSALTLGDQRADWSVPLAGGQRVALSTVVSAGPQATWSTASGFTNLTSGVCTQHPYLDVTTTGQRADTVSVLFPTTSGAAQPAIQPVETATARGVTVRTPDRKDVALTRTAASAVVADGVTSDGARTYVSRTTSGAPRTALLDSGRHLEVDGQGILQASTGVSATLSWGTDGLALKGQITLDGTGTVVLSLAGKKAGSVLVDGKPYAAGQGGVVVLRLPGGAHQVEVTSR